MSGDQIEARALARVATVAQTLADQLAALTSALHAELADSIAQLRDDERIMELFHASTVSNVETFFHVAQHAVAADAVTPPWAALEYARRLAQRGTSSNALVRAYRLGQRRVLDWVFAEIERQEVDARVAFAAGRIVQELTFVYVDRVVELAVAEYEQERERWLASLNTVRATAVASLLTQADVDIDAAERAIGYSLRTNHLGVVLWTDEPDASTIDLRRIERLLDAIASGVGATAPPLFIPRDRSMGWGWVPLRPDAVDVDTGQVAPLLAESEAKPLGVAFGRPAAGARGFRATHAEARRAHAVAMLAGDRARQLTTYADPALRSASLLATDLDRARELVRTELGALGADDESTRRLRETLLCFLAEQGSYVATAEKVHLHKNTVKYRVSKATQLRGRPIDDDRLNLELALIAAEWLGKAVLTDERTR